MQPVIVSAVFAGISISHIRLAITSANRTSSITHMYLMFFDFVVLTGVLVPSAQINLASGQCGFG
jgi:hypothetical protein